MSLNMDLTPLAISWIGVRAGGRGAGAGAHPPWMKTGMASTNLAYCAFSRPNLAWTFALA